MDSDDYIKIEFGDPYVVYTIEYNDARKSLMKWKKPKVFVYLNTDVDIIYEDAETRRIILDYTMPD